MEEKKANQRETQPSVQRTAQEIRTTRETDISLRLNLDGSGSYEIKTGVGFSITCWRASPAMGFSTWS